MLNTNTGRTPPTRRFGRWGDMKRESSCAMGGRGAEMRRPIRGMTSNAPAADKEPRLCLRFPRKFEPTETASLSRHQYLFPPSNFTSNRPLRHTTKPIKPPCRLAAKASPLARCSSSACCNTAPPRLFTHSREEKPEKQASLVSCYYLSPRTGCSLGGLVLFLFLKLLLGPVQHL